MPVISLSTCSVIPELVRRRPGQAYRFLLAVPFRNSFGRASHIAFYLKCHSGTGSAVPVISLSTCSAIPELFRPCQSYRFLLEVPFRNSFGRASHIAFYCSAIPELVRPCQSYRFLLEVPFQNSFGRASHIAFYLQCHSITRSAVSVISLSTCSAIPELVRPCQSYRFLLAVPFRNSSLTKLLKNALGGNSKTIMVSRLGRIFARRLWIIVRLQDADYVVMCLERIIEPMVRKRNHGHW